LRVFELNKKNKFVDLNFNLEMKKTLLIKTFRLKILIHQIKFNPTQNLLKLIVMIKKIIQHLKV
jgi:hypothetical protein